MGEHRAGARKGEGERCGEKIWKGQEFSTIEKETWLEGEGTGI